MRHFVVIATANRGAVEPFEPLDGDGQMSAWASYRLDMTVPTERVVWNGPRPRVSREGRLRVELLMGLVEKAS